MRKMIAAGVLSLAVLVGATTAVAQDTIGVYADFGDGGELSRSLITKVGEPFDIVVVTKTDHESQLIEFKMTELQNIYSGVFKQSTTRFGGQAVIFGDDDIGEQAFGYGACAEPGENEIVRIRYYDVNGSLPANVVLAVWDPGPGTTYVSALDGRMGYVTCHGASVEHLLTPEPWDSASGLDPRRIEGVTSTDGILILNPAGITVSANVSSLSTLKARF